MSKILITDALACPLPPLPFEVERFPQDGPIVQGRDAEALVVWNTPAKVLHPLIGEMPNLRWIQALTNGVDHIVTYEFLSTKTIVTNGRGLHDAPTAEMAVARILAVARQLPRYWAMQMQGKWDKEGYSRHLTLGATLGTLENAYVVIMGMGGVGVEIAKRLKPFGANIVGLATKTGMREGFMTHEMSEMERFIERADVLIMALPETEKTKGILSANLLMKMQKHAWIVNVGRASSIDEAGLQYVLQQGRIAGAALDVFHREPLIHDSAWWKVPNVIITPHVAGGGPRFYKKACALLERNAAKYASGQPLENVINRDRGY